jgi:hypothetical protein
MAHSIKNCLLCRHPGIITVAVGRYVSVRCHGCGAQLSIEFDPPDDPAVKGRIEVLTPPKEGVLTAAGKRNRVGRSVLDGRDRGRKDPSVS